MASVVKIIIEADDKTGGAFDSVAGNFQKLGKIAIAGAAAAGAATLAIGAGLVKLAADAEPLVGLQAGFSSVTERMGSSSDEMLAALQNASAGLITNRDLMQSFNKAASLVGDDFAKTLPESMSLVQKAAQATGQDFGFLMDSLVTGVGRVSPMILDNLGIQVKLADVTELASEMFGKQASELTKTEQQMALNEIVIKKLTEAYGDMEAAEQPIASITTMLSNLKDEIGLKLLPVVQPLAAKFIELAQNALPILAGFLDETLIPALTRVGTAFITIVEAVQNNGLGELFTVFEDGSSRLSFFLTALGMTEETAQSLAATLLNFVNDAITFGQQIWAIIEPVVKAASEFISWQDVLIALGAAIASVIIPILGSIITAVAPIIAIFAAVTLIVAALRNAWESNFFGIQEKTRAVIEFVRNLITTVMGGIKSFWDENGDAILSKAKEIWEAVKNAVETAINTVKDIIERVTGIIKGAWDQHGADILAAAEDFWASVKSAIESAINFIKDDIIVPIANAIKAFWEGHGAELQAVAEGIWSAIETAVDNAFKQIKTLFETFAALFRGDWEGFMEGIKEFWNNAWDAIIEVISTLWDSFRPLLTSMWTSLSTWFSTKVTEMATIGSNLITSLADAIETRANNYLKRIAQGVARLLPQWVKEILGIASPSKVFSWIGVQIGLGLAQGILDSIPNVNDAINRLLDITSSIGTIGGSIMNIFRARISDPLESRLADLDTGIGNATDRINEHLEDMGLGGEFQWETTGPLDRARLLLEAVRRGNQDLAGEIRTVMQLESRRNQTAEEYAEAQERILHLERQQQDLALLKAQQDLLNLIRDNNLSTSILDGLEFGLDADLGRIMDAMSEAMQELLEVTENELGIASPSKRFIEIGKQITAGLARGITSTTGRAIGAMGEILPMGGSTLSSINGLGFAAPVVQKTEIYNVNANYSNWQSESSVVQDIRTLQMLRA